MNRDRSPSTEPSTPPARPPRAELLRAIRALAAALPAQMQGLLDAPRFAAGREALARLADPVHAARAVEQMTDDEAAALAARLSQRWERIATPVFPREATLLAPREIWVEDAPLHVEVEAVAEGVDDDWLAVWNGPVIEGPPSKRATLLVPAPAAGQTVTLHVRAHVRARSRGERCILIAEADILVHRGPRPPD